MSIENRISKLKEEYENIRNYDYSLYEDEFEALNRKQDIETVFTLLEIDFQKFER